MVQFVLSLGKLAGCVLLSAVALHARASDSPTAAVVLAGSAQPVLEKQPVFLFCPHKEGSASLSLFVVVDKNHPMKALALGIESLTGKNAKDSNYNSVLAAQKDPNTARTEISRLDAAEFGRGRLEVRENDMLSIGVTPEKDGLHLEVVARIGIDQHFTVGGPERNRRNMVLQYSYLNKAWVAKSTNLEDTTGHNAAAKYALPLTGIVFALGSTSVSRIVAVDDLGGAIMLMDR